MEIYEVKISAENQQQAEIILDSLLEKRLVTGGQFIIAPARFLWNGKIVDMQEYVTITSYTLADRIDAILADVRKTSVEEVPMVTFGAFHAVGADLYAWVRRTLE